MSSPALIDAVLLAKKVSPSVSSISLNKRNDALLAVSSALKAHKEEILSANAIDCAQAQTDQLGKALYDRLKLTPKKIESLANSLVELAALPDPLNQVFFTRELDQGLILKKVSVPIGVIGVIFESRPDALVQIASLCIKSGNCAILKGGKEANQTNQVVFNLIEEAVVKTDPLFKGSLILAQTREDIKTILSLDQYIDLMIPRGSNELVRFIKENTKIPVMGHADGICHIYVDSEYSLETALSVIRDAKCQYPAVCNAVETLLVHAKAAPTLLTPLKVLLEKEGVELRGDERVCSIISINRAKESDWSTEYNDLILSIKMVDSLDEAIDHINQYGSGHTDAIITQNNHHGESFQRRVDSASVLVNCSTRFADGYRYGFGAEVGIATGKIHSRGPVGLEGLTIYKYLLNGHGDTVAPYVSGEKKFSHKELS